MLVFDQFRARPLVARGETQKELALFFHRKRRRAASRSRRCNEPRAHHTKKQAAPRFEKITNPFHRSILLPLSFPAQARDSAPFAVTRTESRTAPPGSRHAAHRSTLFPGVPPREKSACADALKRNETDAAAKPARLLIAQKRRRAVRLLARKFAEDARLHDHDAFPARRVAKEMPAVEIPRTFVELPEQQNANGRAVPHDPSCFTICAQIRKKKQRSRRPQRCGIGRRIGNPRVRPPVRAKKIRRKKGRAAAKKRGHP